MAIKYKAKYSGNIYDTKEEAIRDNANWLKDPLNRFVAKSKKYPRYKELNIPFIKNKRRTLTNAGFSTGAVISENLLDSIAKYATREGLPIKTALGLAVKESTLGNPTDDKSVYKLIGKDKALFFRRGGRGQLINNKGEDVWARTLVNYYKDSWNPYEEAIKIAKIKATGSNGSFYKPRRETKLNDASYKLALEEYLQQKHVLDSILIAGEKYADNQAKKKRHSITGNVLQAAFRDYKRNPNGYNPGQSNYQQLVNKRAEEVWASPEIQNWYKTYRKRSLENGGKIDIDF